MNNDCERVLRDIGSALLACPPLPSAILSDDSVGHPFARGARTETAEPRDADASSDPEVAESALAWERLPDDARSHLRSCASCRRELHALERMEQVLARGFAEFDRATSLPDSDQITSILRRVTDEPTVAFWQRTRRSVRTMLWLSLLLLSLLGACGLIALAYRVLFSGNS